jgi:hypothetical protein
MRLASSSPAPAHRRKSRIESTLRHTWRHIHFRFPRLLPSPYRDENEYLKQRDIDDNLSSRIPGDERLRQTALWGVEVYGPGEADTLNLALDCLGWNDDRLFGLSTNPSSWIGEQRTYGTEGNLNLGVIERPGKSRFLHGVRTAPLPEGVDYAHGYVYQLSPSFTAIILCFVFTDSASETYHIEINLDRKTFHEPLDGGYRSYAVEHAKRLAVEQARSRSRALIVEWFAQHLPGRFSSASDGNRLPTAELITTTSKTLFGESGKVLEPNWIDLLSPRGHRQLWTHKGCKGLSLCWPDSDGDLRYHAIVNLQTNLLTSDHLQHRGEHGDAAHRSFVSDQVEGVLVNYAAFAALREIVRFLRLTPSSLTADTTTRRGTVKCLERIRNYFERTVGIPVLTSELVSRSEKIHSYEWSCVAFQAEAWQPNSQPIEIAEALRSRTHFLATRAVNLEKETREHLEQLSTILSTRENIRTQSRMELVAVGAAILRAHARPGKRNRRGRPAGGGLFSATLAKRGDR